eukprot:gene382-623_t
MVALRDRIQEALRIPSPAVRVPPVTHSVPIIDCKGCTWLEVTYVPLRIGWAVTNTLLTCFSNRLLARLRSAKATVEAVMGVAFLWEAAAQTQL